MTMLTVGDQTRRFSEWAEVSGIKESTLRYRIRCGWSPSLAVTTLVSTRNRRLSGTVLRSTHGDFGTKEHRAWAHMLGRCLNPADSSYARYGGRGVRVHPSWKGHGGYLKFLAHVGRAPSQEHTIERIDNDGGYEPGNVRWATRTEQARNRRSTRFVTAFGETKSLAAWAESSGIGFATIRRRLEVGWSAEKAVSCPPDYSGRAGRESRWGTK